MTIVVAPLFALADMLACLGLGFMLGLFYHGAVLAFKKSRAAVFCMDVLGAALAAVLLTGFGAGQSYSGQVRWYMAAALAAGLWAYFQALAPWVSSLWQLAAWLFARPWVLFSRAVVQPLGRAILKIWLKMGEKIRRIAIKHHKKQLKKQSKMLYNSSN